MTKRCVLGAMFWRSMLMVVGAVVLSTSLPAAAEESPKELVTRYFEGCFAAEVPGCLKEFWPKKTADFIAEQAKRRRELFPDIRYELVEVIAEGERVVAIFRVVGKAAEPKESPTGGVLDHEEVAFYTVRDGKLVSGDVIADLRAVEQALGL